MRAFQRRSCDASREKEWPAEPEDPGGRSPSTGQRRPRRSLGSSGHRHPAASWEGVAAAHWTVVGLSKRRPARPRSAFLTARPWPCFILPHVRISDNSPLFRKPLEGPQSPRWGTSPPSCPGDLAGVPSDPLRGGARANTSQVVAQELPLADGRGGPRAVVVLRLGSACPRREVPWLA